MDSILNLLEERDKKFSVLLEQDAATLTDKYLELKHDVQSLETSKAEYSAKFSSLQANGLGTASSSDISQLNSQLVDLYREKDNLITKNTEIQENIQKLQNEKLEANNDSKNINENQERLEAELLELNEKRTTYEQKLDRLSNELTQINEQKQNMQIELNRLKETLEIYEGKINESSKYIKEAEKSSPHVPMKKFLTKIKAHSSGINAVCFGPSYQSLFTVGEDKKLIQWSLPRLTEILNISTKSTCNQIRYHQESNLACLSCQDKTIRILDASTGRFISELLNHLDQCTDSCWISRNQLLSVSLDRTVKLFDLTKNAVSSTIPAISAVHSICATHEPSVFAIGSSDGNLRLIDTRMRKVAQKIEKVHQGTICSLCSSINGETIYSLGVDGCLCETSLKNMTRMKQRTDPNLEVKRGYSAKLSLNIDGGYICAPSNKGCVCVFDLLSDSPPIINKCDNGATTCSAYAANMLVTGDKNHTLTFWV